MAKVPIPRDRRYNLAKARLLWPFNRKYRQRCALARVPVVVRPIIPYVVLTRDHRFIFVKNSKAACTTVTQILYRYANDAYLEKGVHGSNEGLVQGIREAPRLVAALSARSAQTFTFVRDPLERFMSGFRHSLISSPRNPNFGYHQAAMESRGFSETATPERKLDFFIDYVAESLSDEPEYADHHWRPQHFNVARDHVRYDYIGRAERLMDGLRPVFHAAGAGDFIDRVAENTAFNRTAPLDLHLTDVQRSRVRDLYKRDYDTFGFDDPS